MKNSLAIDLLTVSLEKSSKTLLSDADGLIAALQAKLGDHAEWIDYCLLNGFAPRSKEVIDIVSGVHSESLLSLTKKQLATAWSFAASETWLCDIFLCGLLKCRAPKSFSLLRGHALPPWRTPQLIRLPDGRLQAKLFDVRAALQELGLTPPTDEVSDQE